MHIMRNAGHINTIPADEAIKNICGRINDLLDERYFNQQALIWMDEIAKNLKHMDDGTYLESIPYSHVYFVVKEYERHGWLTHYVFHETSGKYYFTFKKV